MAALSLPCSPVVRVCLAGEQLLRPGVWDQAARTYFSRGHCHSLALALHALTGLPLVAVSCRRLGMGFIHVEVGLPDGRVADAHGISGTDDGDERRLVSAEDLLRLLFDPEDDKPWDYPADPEFAWPWAESLAQQLGLGQGGMGGTPHSRQSNKIDHEPPPQQSLAGHDLPGPDRLRV